MWLKIHTGADAGGRVHRDHVVSLTPAQGDDPSKFAVRATLVTAATFRVSPDFDTRSEAEAEIDRLLLDGS